MSINKDIISSIYQIFPLRFRQTSFYHKFIMNPSMIKSNCKRKSISAVQSISTKLIDKKPNIPSVHHSTKQVQGIVKKQIRRVNELIKNICNQYIPLSTFITQDSKCLQKQIKLFRNMQHQIRRRNIQIRLLEEEIKDLQNGRINSSQKVIQVYLSEELSTKSAVLEKSMLKFKQKYQKYTKFKQRISQIQHLYISKCLNEAVQAISYDEFKEIYLKQRALQNNQVEYRPQTQRFNKKQLAQKNGNRNCVLSANQLKQRDFNIRTNEKRNYTGRRFEENTMTNIDVSNKHLKDLLNKKNVAEAALKAAKRKHIVQMNNYESKLQFLSDQYQQLENKLNQKIRELTIAEKKFKQSRRRQNSVRRRTQLRNIRTQTN